MYERDVQNANGSIVFPRQLIRSKNFYREGPKGVLTTTVRQVISRSRGDALRSSRSR